jgi:hypothetical protein
MSHGDSGSSSLPALSATSKLETLIKWTTEKEETLYRSMP